MVVSLKFDRYDGRMGSMKEYLSIMRRYKSTRLFHDCTWVASSCSVLFLYPPWFLVCCRFRKAPCPISGWVISDIKIRCMRYLIFLFLLDLFQLPKVFSTIVLCRLLDTV